MRRNAALYYRLCASLFLLLPLVFNFVIYIGRVFGEWCAEERMYILRRRRENLERHG